MSEINSIANGTFTIGQTSANDSSLLVTQNENSASILQGTVATSAGIVGDGTTQNPLRADETVLYKFTGSNILETSAYNLNEAYTNFNRMRITFVYNDGYSLCQEYDTNYDSTHIPAPMGITQTTDGSTYCKVGGFTHNNEHTQISRTASYDIANFTGKNAAKVVSIASVVGINRKA